MSKGLNQQAEERLWHHRIDSNGTTLRTAIRAAAWVSSVWCIMDQVGKLAGQHTILDIGAHLGASLTASATVTISVTIALVGVGWGAIERWLRHRKVGQLSDRIRELETRLDPQRTSSGLTKHGKTNPKDSR